jgi:hypothetical protein
VRADALGKALMRRAAAGAAPPPLAQPTHLLPPSSRQVRIRRVGTVLATRASTDTLAGLPGMLMTLAPSGLETAGAAGLLEPQTLQSTLIGGRGGQHAGAPRQGTGGKGAAACEQAPARPAPPPTATSPGPPAAPPGPPGCRAYTHAFKPYINHNVQLSVVEAGPSHEGPVVSAQELTITPVVVAPRTGGAAADGAPQEEPVSKRPRTEGAAAGAGAAAAAPEEASVACYICQLPDMAGKFDPAKAKELGVKPGPVSAGSAPGGGLGELV